MIRTMIYVTLAAIGSLYLPEAPEFDTTAPVEVLATAAGAPSEAAALELAWKNVDAEVEKQCAEQARSGGAVDVATESVQWAPGGYHAEVFASGVCRF